MPPRLALAALPISIALPSRRRSAHLGEAVPSPPRRKSRVLACQTSAGRPRWPLPFHLKTTRARDPMEFSRKSSTTPSPILHFIANFPWTKPRLSVSFTTMSQPETKLTSPVSLAVDAILVLAFFLFIYSLVSTHVPSNDPQMIRLWGVLCSACMSGVFWLCIQMFRVVLRAQRAAGKK